jgi:hypothetical protein
MFKRWIVAAFISSLLILSVTAAEGQEFLIKLPDSTANNWRLSIEGKTDVPLKKWGILSTETQIEQIFNVSKPPLLNWFIVKKPATIEIDFATLYKSDKILHYQQNNLLKVHVTSPNDSLYSEQWYHQKIKAVASWENYSVNPEVLIAVIDTGIDYNHLDLQGSLWINSAEDQNQNGILDSLDINHFDDDANGYIDDVVGWDFTDARRFPDSGDFKSPDNDPMDEFSGGHGTQIAGIIAAQTNNTIGIAGLLPGVKVMNLRAGTSQGYLEEDDVARAILYALNNGAQIINMSFGDIVVSRFLQDVIEYAYSQGAVLIASAGNSGSNEIHYPAGFPQTISVGATSFNDQPADFSNWGHTVDLVAPGVGIVAPKRGGGYNMVQGTSFSAPMVAAGAGLILSNDPQFSNETIRNIIKTTVDDIGISASMDYFGSGRMNMLNMSQMRSDSKLMIHYPVSGSSTAKYNEAIIVTAQDPNLIALNLQFGVGDNPLQWHDIVTNYPYQVIRDTLGILDLIEFSDTLIVLRLVYRTWDLSEHEYRSILHIDRTAPQILRITNSSLLDDNFHSVLLSFETDDICTGRIFYRTKDSADPFDYKNLNYESRNHKMLFNAQEIQGENEFYIEITNTSGMQLVADNGGEYFSLQINPEPITQRSFTALEWTFPAGYLLPYATDFDADDNFEIVISQYDLNNSYGAVAIYEFSENGFKKVSQTNFRAIPRSTGDSDGDGKEELLLGFGRKSYLLEASLPNTFPTDIIWQDTLNFWASQIADMDQDGEGEIIGRVNNEYKILETVGDNQFTERSTINNPSMGENNLGPPKTLICDLDGDGFLEFVFGDYDGDINIFENVADDSYEWRHSERLLFADATDYIVAGNYISDSFISLIAGTHSDEENYEHELDVRYWQYNVINAHKNDSYHIEQDINVNGYSDIQIFNSGLGSGGRSSGALDYLFLAPYPNLYLFAAQNGKLNPLWHYKGAQTNTVLSHDFDNNGENFIGFELEDQKRPIPPSQLIAIPLDTVAIELSWKSDPSADKYIIYRGNSQLHLTKYDSTQLTAHYIDAQVYRGSCYYYALQTIDYSFENPASVLSRIEMAKPNTPPHADSILVVNDRQCQIYFNEKMDRETLVAQNFQIKTPLIPASSVVPFLNDRAILVSFGISFPQNEVLRLQLKHIRDCDKTLLDQNSRLLDLIYLAQGDKPYIVNWSFTENRVLSLTFNMAMDTSTVLEKANYELEPSGFIEEVIQKDGSDKEYLIVLSQNSYSGATGFGSYLICNNLRNIHGQPFDQGNRINLICTPDNLENIFVYPQPASIKTDWIMFANVTPETEIDIFDIGGRRVAALKETDANGGVRWNLKNFVGQKIAAGVYFYRARSEKETKMGKLTVVR